jgi:hypothetical protein
VSGRVDPDPEKLRLLDEEIAAAKAGAGWYLPRDAQDIYLRDVFEHPDGGGLYDSLDCPNGSKVVVLRDFRADGLGPVWLRMLPVGPRADHLPTRRQVGTPEEMHNLYTKCVRELSADGWRIAEPVRIDMEVVEVEPTQLVS